MTINITNNITKEKLAEWIESIKECAKADTESVIHWFGQTASEPFSIVAGWQKYFINNDFSDLFCVSRSHPEYVMCVKVAINDGSHTYTDFDAMNMPLDELGNVDDTCIPLEWEDDPEIVAMFFLHEWERIMKEYKEEQ